MPAYLDALSSGVPADVAYQATQIDVRNQAVEALLPQLTITDVWSDDTFERMTVWGERCVAASVTRVDWDALTHEEQAQARRWMDEAIAQRIVGVIT